MLPAPPTHALSGTVSVLHHRNRRCRRMRFTMRNTNQHFADAQFRRFFCRTAMQANARLTARLNHHFDIAPRNTGDPACTEGFQYRFLCRPATRKMLFGNLPIGKLAVELNGNFLNDRLVFNTVS